MTRIGLRDVTNVQTQKPASKRSSRTTSDKSEKPDKALNNQNPHALLLNARALGIGLKTDEQKRKEDRDPQQVSDYVDHIHKYLRQAENNLSLRVTNPNFLDDQPEISARMRGILLDWLVEVHYKFKLVPETLYLTVNLIDRYLSKEPSVSRRKLQLVGGTCLLLASKYEEFRPPEVGDICYIMDNAYSRDDILDMEVSVLNVLKFQVTVPNSLQFLSFLIGAMGISRAEDHFFLAQYLIESTLLDVKFLKHKPSELAAASLYLANRIRKLPAPWPTKLVEVTGLDEITLVKPLAKEIFEGVPNFRNKSLWKKYSMEKYRSVAPSIPLQ